MFDESYPVTFQSPSKKAGTARTKLDKGMAPRSSMYDVDFIITMGEYELAVRRDQTGKAHFVLAGARLTYEGMETMIILSPMCSARKIRKTLPRYWER